MNVQRIDLPVESDTRGALTYIESMEEIPFDIERVFYIYDVPADVTRGQHAHREGDQFLIAVAGSVTVTAESGDGAQEMVLDTPATGLYVPTWTWVELTEFSKDAVLLVLSSVKYDPDEYITDHDEVVQG